MKRIVIIALALALAFTPALAFKGTRAPDPAGTGSSWGTESGSHILYVNGARTDSYTANGSISYPYKTIQAALDWVNTDAAAQMSTANGLWARYVVKVAAGNYTENLTINNPKYLRVEMEGVRVTGNVNLLTTQGAGDYYSKIEFVGCPSNRAFRGRCGEITGKVYGTRNNDALIYVAFNGMNLMGDIVAATNGTWVMYFNNCSWNALDGNGNQTNTGTPYMYTRDLAIILVEGQQSQFKGHIADSAVDATPTKVEIYDAHDCRFDLINVTPTNEMRTLNCRFDSDVTVTARSWYMDNVSYTNMKARTNTLTGCTIVSSEPKFAGPITDTLKMTSAKPVMFGAVPLRDSATTILRTPNRFSARGLNIDSADVSNKISIGADTRMNVDFWGVTSGLLIGTGQSLTDSGGVRLSLAANRAARLDTVIAPGQVVTPKVANGTGTLKLGSDSLIITPEGGIAVLMKNGVNSTSWTTDSTLYKGNPVDVLYNHRTVHGATSQSGNAYGIVYSDSIKNNEWGYVVIHGICKAAWSGSFAASSAQLATTNRYLVSGGIAFDKVYFGAVVDTVRQGANARGDSLLFITVNPVGVMMSSP